MSSPFHALLPRIAAGRLSRWAWVAATLLTRAVFTPARVEVRHAERVPPDGPVVLVANHVNQSDPLLLLARAPRRVRPLAKRELFEIPLVGWYFWLYGAIPVRRYAADMGALRAASGYLKRGEAVLVFPEGTRSRDGRLRPALPGAATVALLSGAPMLPVAVSGTRGLSPRRLLTGWLLRRRPRIRIEFGEPLDPRASQPSPSGRSAPVGAGVVAEATDRVMRALAALLAEEARGAYAEPRNGSAPVVARSPQPAREGSESRRDPQNAG